MMVSSISPRSPRFPLFSKITAGLAFIIIFMILSSSFLLYQMNDVFSTGEVEFRSLQVSQYLQRLFTLESDAAAKYFQTGDSALVLNFYRISGYFQMGGDSLLRMVSNEADRNAVESV